MFYNATVPSVLMYNSAAFYGLLTQALKKDLNRSYNLCGKFVDYSLIHCNDVIYNKLSPNLCHITLHSVWSASGDLSIHTTCPGITIVTRGKQQLTKQHARIQS